MPTYEHTFLARQDVTQAQVEQLMKDFTAVIEQGEGKVAKQEYWGLKGLAYKIKKNRKAHYAFFNLDAAPAAIAEMERQMSLNTDVIRFMTVRVETLEEEPSIQMRKQEREDRFGSGNRGGGGFAGRGGPRGGGGGREGGSTFRSRPTRDGAGAGPDRGPRPPRDANNSGQE